MSTDARAFAQTLADLLRREHDALADFILALAEFHRHHHWETLGYTSLFHFLHRHLGLSKGSAFFRKTAAELVQTYPEVADALRDGRLCFSTVVELAKVLTPDNRDEVLPRFFHRSKQEAKEVAAELRPHPSPPMQDRVTTPPTPGARPSLVAAGPLLADTAPAVQPVGPVHASPGNPSWAVSAAIASESALPAQRAVVEPLSADARRLHVTVSKRLLDKLEAARNALAHAKPSATTEEILEAALDALLAAQAKRREARLVRSPAAAAPALAPKPSAAADRESSSRYVPRELRRQVFARDGGCCQWRMEAGAICGSRHGVEIDHVIPVALGGTTTLENLRLLCAAHNRLAGRATFGDFRAGHAGRRGRGRGRSTAARRVAAYPGSSAEP